MPMSGQQGLPMVRLVAVALLNAMWVAPAAAQTDADDESWRLRELRSFAASDMKLPGADISPNARIGVGMFGPKRDGAQGRGVTVRDVNMPKQRRAGVGFSLKF